VADDEPLSDLTPEDAATGEVEILQQDAAVIQPSRKRLAPAPIRSVSEKGPYGALPRIAKNGKKPWLVYARPVSHKELTSNSPKIAIVLGGMGLNRRLTDQAIKQMPGEITLAFAPYGKGLQKQINSARRAGHEVMLQLPMEPFGYPTVDPGPKTLLVKDAADVTVKNLKWHMSRFSGYIGIINYMGGRFTSQGDGIGYVLRDVNKRGLVYLDDGTSRRSVVPSLGQVMNAPVRVTNMVIDGEGSYNAISSALSRLEQQAATDGFAIGLGSGLAVTMDALNTWARDLRSRNIILVPVSAAYRAQQS
ncbi:MAG: divergent polysaccharide deacetylase family protein, partial [Aestuariivirgaceae bacterium]